MGEKSKSHTILAHSEELELHLFTNPTSSLSQRDAKVLRPFTPGYFSGSVFILARILGLLKYHKTPISDFIPEAFILPPDATPNSSAMHSYLTL
jgi:hypothetical protein